MSFNRPSTPVTQPEAPPVVEDTEAKAQDYASMLRKRKGRAAAILTERAAPAAETAAKTLLGS
jgi:hypothetical protein